MEAVVRRLLKSDSNTGASLWILRNISEHLFLQNTSDGCFCPYTGKNFLLTNWSSLAVQVRHKLLLTKHASRDVVLKEWLVEKIYRPTCKNEQKTIKRASIRYLYFHILPYSPFPCWFSSKSQLLLVQLFYLSATWKSLYNFI